MAAQTSVRLLVRGLSPGLSNEWGIAVAMLLVLSSSSRVLCNPSSWSRSNPSCASLSSRLSHPDSVRSNLLPLQTWPGSWLILSSTALISKSCCRPSMISFKNFTSCFNISCSAKPSSSVRTFLCEASKDCILVVSLEGPGETRGYWEALLVEGDQEMKCRKVEELEPMTLLH